MWVSIRSDTNRALQAQKMARGWKFRIYKVEELYYPSSENRGANQLRSKLIYASVFAYAECLFSYDAAQVLHCLCWHKNGLHLQVFSYVHFIFTMVSILKISIQLSFSH